jgi:hypothetical protein
LPKGERRERGWRENGITVMKLCGKPDMSRQNYYKGRAERRRREVDSGLTGQPVLAQRAVQPAAVQEFGQRYEFGTAKPGVGG